MNATVVIPTYWAGDDACANAPGTYDHSTRLNADNPELDRCLASLEQVRDIPRIILLVVCLSMPKKFRHLLWVLIPL